MNLIEGSEWDTNHFGFKVARMNKITFEELQPALKECVDSGVKLLIHRCSTEDFHYIHQLGRQPQIVAINEWTILANIRVIILKLNSISARFAKGYKYYITDEVRKEVK